MPLRVSEIEIEKALPTRGKASIMAEAKTLNDAPSLATTGNARVNVFFKVTRDLSEDDLRTLLTAAWAEDPLDTLKLIFHLRDCRGGKGEKKQFHHALKWLTEEHLPTLLRNLEHVPQFGYFKDLLTLLGTDAEEAAIATFCAQLTRDRLRLDSGVQLGEISLAAKWAPTEGCAHDKKFRAVPKFATKLSLNKANYRKQLLVPLRTYLKIVEAQMCSGKWEDIDFSRVPSVAMKRYSKLFLKHSPERYAEFLAKVRTGEAKMNVGRLHPHEILEEYLGTKARQSTVVNETTEVAWKEYLRGLRERIKLRRSLAVVDVSGSMAGIPLQVALALGLITAELTDGPFHNRWITFSARPQLETIKGATLHEQLDNMIKSSWDMNTNFQAVFDLILESAQLFGATQEQMPETIFVFSDMQFDQAGGSRKTNFEVLKEKYARAGYTLPKLVFWNLRAENLDFPTTAEEANVALVSGFSPDLLTLFLEDGEITPYKIMRSALDNERYACLAL